MTLEEMIQKGQNKGKFCKQNPENVFHAKNMPKTKWGRNLQEVSFLICI